MTRASLVNLTLIQIGWFIAVLGAANGHAWPAAAFVAVVAAVYLSRSPQRSSEGLMLLIAAALGIAADTALLQLGLVRFAASWPSEHLAPVWILSLWVLLSTAFSRSMAWLSGRPHRAAAVAAAAPLTYWAGVRLGAAEFPAGVVPSLVGIGIVWIIALPVLAFAAGRVLGHAVPPANNRKTKREAGSDRHPGTA